MKAEKFARCKRCGSTEVAWHQSKKTGKWYLAYALYQRGFTTYGPDSAHVTAGSIQVYPQIPHNCDDQLSGGFNDPKHPRHHLRNQE